METWRSCFKGRLDDSFVIVVIVVVVVVVDYVLYILYTTCSSGLISDKPRVRNRLVRTQGEQVVLHSARAVPGTSRVRDRKMPRVGTPDAESTVIVALIIVPSPTKNLIPQLTKPHPALFPNALEDSSLPPRKFPFLPVPSFPANHNPHQPLSAAQRRFLSIHEHQSMTLLNAVSSAHALNHAGTHLLPAQYGIPTPKSVPAKSPQEAFDVARSFRTSNIAPRVLFSVSGPGHNRLVIKAQVLAGGRGKGAFDNGFQGGVHMVDRYISLNLHLRNENISLAVPNKQKILPPE